ncbi:hypothetical protein ACWD4T_03670 [Streptomyces umbrinus]
MCWLTIARRLLLLPLEVLDPVGMAFELVERQQLELPGTDVQQVREQRLQI